MIDIVLPCSCCGNMLTFAADCALLSCPACGMPNAQPCAQGPALDVLRHAVRQRLGNDFTNAERSYQQVLLDYPDAHEALWGRLLCHYGVEYVEDPATRRLMPTVHTIRRKPLRTQPEFRDACAFAPDDVRARYEEDAAYIDDAQASIRLRASACPPFDVFLCHKTTKPGSGDKTEDYHRAFQLYTYLREQGLRPFFAPESLQAVAGADYEAGIYHALETSRLMLLLCSDPEYLTSAWVRSEWSRFIERMDEGAPKRLVPLLYDHFNPARLPAEFRYRRIQGFTMGELTSTERLMALVRDTLGVSEPPRSAPAPQPAPAVPAPQPAPHEAYNRSPEPPQTPAAQPAPWESYNRKPEPPQAPVTKPAPREAYNRNPEPPQTPAAQPAPRQDPRPLGIEPSKHFVIREAEDYCIITKYTGSSENIRIPPMIGQLPVTGIGSHTFQARISLQRIIIPEGVTSIGTNAFAGCTALTEVVLPSTLRYIGAMAFSGCTALKRVELPRKLATISDNTFRGCSALETITLPEEVTIHGGAFDGCRSLPHEIREIITRKMTLIARLSVNFDG